MKAVFHRGLVM